MAPITNGQNHRGVVRSGSQATEGSRAGFSHHRALRPSRITSKRLIAAAHHDRGPGGPALTPGVTSTSQGFFPAIRKMPIPTAPIPHSNLAQKTGGNRSAFKGYDSQKKLDFAANFSAVNARRNKKSKKREPWPRIKQVVNHGKTVYLCDARIKGRGERRFFETKREAEGWQQQRVKRQNEGGKAFDDRELARHGWNVADASRFTLEHLRKQTSSVASRISRKTS